MKKVMSFREALCLAQHDELESDPTVFLYGLDVGDHKCTFGSTKGLREKFGDTRVFSTPLSEDAMTGVGIGAAISGLRPIQIHIRADFLLLAMNQLVNMAGNVRYYSKGTLRCPLTVRAVIGRGWGQGAQHSKEIYQMFQWVPGVKVVIPSNPQDAYSLLRGAIHDNDPVVFFEHRWLYDVVGEVDTELDVHYGKEKIVRGGYPDENPARACSWGVIEALKHPLRDVIDHRGIDYTCKLPPVPTARVLENEWYKLRYKYYNAGNIDTYEDRFKGPF